MLEMLGLAGWGAPHWFMLLALLWFIGLNQRDGVALAFVVIFFVLYPVDAFADTEDLDRGWTRKTLTSATGIDRPYGLPSRSLSSVTSLHCGSYRVIESMSGCVTLEDSHSLTPECGSFPANDVWDLPGCIAGVPESLDFWNPPERVVWYKTLWTIVKPVLGAVGLYRGATGFAGRL